MKTILGNKELLDKCKKELVTLKVEEINNWMLYNKNEINKIIYKIKIHYHNLI